MASEDELLAKLERWLSGRRTPPSIFEVIDAGDGELLAAYVLKGFRAAAAETVNDRISVEGAKLFPTTSADLAAAVMRVFDGLGRAWSLTESEQLHLLGLQSSGELGAMREAHPQGLPPLILERIAILLDIFKVINTLLPEPTAADAWIRKPNKAPLFAGRSALDLMTMEGLPALRSVRAFLRTS